MTRIGPGTPEDRERHRRYRELIAEELPELIEKGHRIAEAAEEPTPSGELRRAIHASRVPLSEIAVRSGTDVLALDMFLAGDAPLPSDVIDRLAGTLGYALTRTA